MIKVQNLHGAALFMSATLFASVVHAAEPSSFLKIANDVPKDQSQLLKEDVNRLSNFKGSYVDKEMSVVMGFSGPVTSKNLLQWLSDRVQYVVSEKIDLEKSLVVLAQKHRYENPGILPDMPAEKEKTNNTDTSPSAEKEREVMTVMTNIGGALYTVGKQSGMLLGFKIPGQGVAKMSSPRTGVIQIGKGLFALRSKDANASPRDLERSYFRLSTLFHEARHSDGNGKTLSFFHNLCPKGHAYEDYYACDRSLNGSYSVGAYVTRALTENCADCTPAQKEVMRLEYVDSFSRVIREWSDVNPYDGALKEICDKMMDLKMPLPECDKFKTPAVKQAIMLDARPEGKR